MASFSCGFFPATFLTPQAPPKQENPGVTAPGLPLFTRKSQFQNSLGFEEENPNSMEGLGHSLDDRRLTAGSAAGGINQLLCIRFSIPPFGVVLATVIATKAIGSLPGCTPLCG